MGWHALLQGIFLIQGQNHSLFCLLHWQVCSLPLVPAGKPISLSNLTCLFVNKSILRLESKKDEIRNTYLDISDRLACCILFVYPFSNLIQHLLKDNCQALCQPLVGNKVELVRYCIFFSSGMPYQYND